MSSINLNEMFAEFNDTYGYSPIEFNSVNLKKAVKLISDEVVETLIESDANILDKASAAKELTDILYMTMQQMSAFGLDIQECLKEVHRSNLSKKIPKGQAKYYIEEVRPKYPNAYATIVNESIVLRCGDTGKVIKPSCYSPANMSHLVK